MKKKHNTGKETNDEVVCGKNKYRQNYSIKQQNCTVQIIAKINHCKQKKIFFFLFIKATD